MKDVNNTFQYCFFQTLVEESICKTIVSNYSTENFIKNHHFLNIMFTDNVTLKAAYEGKRADMEGGLAQTVEAELLNRTGLKVEAVTLAPEQRYTVTLQGLEGGQRSDKTYIGTSTEGIEAAVREASRLGTVDLDQSTFKVEVERRVAAPYFKVPLVSRSLRRESLPEYHTAAVGQLADTYGKRLNPNPDSMEFRVIRARDSYNEDGVLPKGEFVQDRVVAEGRSNTSIGDALERSKGFKLSKTRSTVFEQTAMMMVYGQPEERLTVGETGIASRMVATGKGALTVVADERSGKGRGYGSGAAVPAAAAASASASARAYAGSRGASPAAKDPAPLTSPNALM